MPQRPTKNLASGRRVGGAGAYCTCRVLGTPIGRDSTDEAFTFEVHVIYCDKAAGAEATRYQKT